MTPYWAVLERFWDRARRDRDETKAEVKRVFQSGDGKLCVLDDHVTDPDPGDVHTPSIRDIDPWVTPIATEMGDAVLLGSPALRCPICDTVMRWRLNADHDAGPAYVSECCGRDAELDPVWVRENVRSKAKLDGAVYNQMVGKFT